MSRIQTKIIVMLTSLLILVLACSSENRVGTLSKECLPEKFVLYGEVGSTWTADVSSGLKYSIIVQPTESTYSLNDILIVVADDNRKPITYDSKIVKDSIVLDLVAPGDGKILIEVSSKSGENGTQLGTFIVKLCERGP